MMALNLIIVEDETKTRNGLLNHLDWKTLGIDMIQTAQSGDEALAICRDYQPDIVLSDIRMRGMTGIELCYRLREMYPDCQIIFISSYSAKEYLKAAIDLKAVTYVEKPISKTELRDAFGKAIRAVQESRRNQSVHLSLSSNLSLLRRSLVMELLEKGMDENVKTGMDVVGLFDHPWPCYRACIVHTSRKIMKMMPFMETLFPQRAFPQTRELERAFFYLNNQDILVLLQGSESALQDTSAFLSALQKRVSSYSGDGIRLFLAAGSTVGSVAQLPASFEKAKAAMEQLFFDGYGHWASAKATPSAKKQAAANPDDFMDFYIAVKSQDIESVNRCLEAIQREIGAQKGITAFSVRNIYYNLFHQLKRAAGSLAKNAALTKIERQIAEMTEIETLSELHGCLARCAQELIQQEREHEGGSLAVSKVVHYINNHYEESDLTLAKLADLVYLTPTYLSTLFKTSTNQTVGQYITQTRIEMAKELLKDPQHKLYQVASMVGYDDANYFAKVFKKATGMSPKDYRENGLS